MEMEALEFLVGIRILSLSHALALLPPRLERPEPCRRATRHLRQVYLVAMAGDASTGERAAGRCRRKLQEKGEVRAARR